MARVGELRERREKRKEKRDRGGGVKYVEYSGSNCGNLRVDWQEEGRVRDRARSG